MSGLPSEVGDDDKVVFAVTVKYKYEMTGAQLKQYYKTLNLTEAADIDRANLLSDPALIVEDLDYSGRDYDVRVSAARFLGE